MKLAISKGDQIQVLFSVTSSSKKVDTLQKKQSELTTITVVCCPTFSDLYKVSRQSGSFVNKYIRLYESIEVFEFSSEVANLFKSISRLSTALPL